MLITLKTINGLVSCNIPSENFFHLIENKFNIFLEMFNKDSEIFFEPQNKQDGETLILAYCKSIDLEQDIPKPLKVHFYKSFNQFLNGGRLEKSLGLVNPAKRPRSEEKATRDLDIYKDIVERMQLGLSLLDAAMELSEIYHLHESHIQKIYSIIKKFKDIEDKEDKEIPF